MQPSDLLERLSTTLRSEIGPAVEEEYPRTQAFLGAVVLQKLARQLRFATEHAEAEVRERAALQADLEQLLAGTATPARVGDALKGLVRDGDAGLCRLIEALYAARATLGEAEFERLIGRVRASLRQTLERRLEYSA